MYLFFFEGVGHLGTVLSIKKAFPVWEGFRNDMLVRFY